MNPDKSQIKALKKLAHHLQPVVMIGQHGLTDSVLGKIEESLLSHELIKIKFIDFKDEKQELLHTIQQDTGSSLVALVGHVAVLYRPDPDPENRKIKL